MSHLSLGVNHLIGVVSKIGQSAIVEEFFQLFKTPWESYRHGEAYDVVIATADDIPEVDAKLMLVYGSEPKNTDVFGGIAVHSRLKGATLDNLGTAVPLYGELVTFEQPSGGAPFLAATGGMVAGLRIVSATGTTLIRLGYDLFHEAQILISSGQPAEHAHIPTLDIHIEMLRNWILSEGINLLEIPPLPAGYSFAVCLTHDIDFVGIRNHILDHTMWGFLYRSTVDAVRNFLRGRISIRRLFEGWRAVASLPLVYLGWVKDFWSPFEWYLRVEKDLPATYFLIPFKRNSGENVPGAHAARRATAYDVDDLHDWMRILRSEGCELGVHGIDAWHSIEKGRAELSRLARITGEASTGIRMHWLLRNSNSASILDQSGYAYDSTAGYNDTIGYFSGTSQVFRPLAAKTLLELPLHIQDGALFYGTKLDLSELEAEERCKDLIGKSGHFGGVLTILWHDRSHAPERFWGDFYVSLVELLTSSDAWFATAGQVVRWFQTRREVRFERIGASIGQRCIAGQKEMTLPPLCLRIYRPRVDSSGEQRRAQSVYPFIDFPWDADTVAEYHPMKGPFDDQIRFRGSAVGANEVRLPPDPKPVRA